LSLKWALVDGIILSVLISIVVLGSIYVDPRMWVDDYPPDIQAAVGPVQTPPGQVIVGGVFFAAAVVGVPLWSNARLRRRNHGKLSFWAAFANSALLFFVFAVWDLLVLDWLLFVTIRPSFMVIPGTEGLAGYKDYWFHFRVSFLGWVQWASILAAGLVMAGLSMIRIGGRREDGPRGVY